MRFSFGDLGGIGGGSQGDDNAADDPFAGFELPAPVTMEGGKSASGSGADPSAGLRGLDFARAAGVDASHSTSLGLKPALKRGSFTDSSVMKTSHQTSAAGQGQSFSAEAPLDNTSFGRSAAPRRATAVSFAAPGEDDEGAATADGAPPTSLPPPPPRPDRTPSAFSASPASTKMSPATAKLSPAALRASPQKAAGRPSGFRRGTVGSVPKVPTPNSTPTRTQSSDRMAQSARKPTPRDSKAAEAGTSLTPRIDRSAREQARAERDARRAAATRQRRAQSVGGLGSQPSMFDDVNDDDGDDM